MTDSSAEKDLLLLLVDDDDAEYEIFKRKLSGVNDQRINLEYVSDIGSAVERVGVGGVDLVLLDNRLFPNNDFRETAPQLRQAGYIGPIGIISSDLSGTYFRELGEFGVDFRIGKSEIDASVISFIVAEYTNDVLSATCAEDYQ